MADQDGGIRLRWWRVQYQRFFDTTWRGIAVKTRWKGWHAYGWAWRWECRLFKDPNGTRIMALKSDFPDYNTFHPPPAFMKFYNLKFSAGSNKDLIVNADGNTWKGCP